MKMTIPRALFIAGFLISILVVAFILLTMLNIDRKVSVNGSFVYRKTTPIVVNEPGFVRKILKEENCEILKGDTIAILENKDLEMEIEDVKSKIMIIELELEDILNMKQFDLNLNSLDITKLKSELKLKEIEEQYYLNILTDKKEMLKKKIISQAEFDEAEINHKSIVSEKRSLEINIDEISKKLNKLDSSSLLHYKLKQKDYESQITKLKYLEHRMNSLVIISHENGKLLAEKMEKLKNTYLEKGSQLGDVVSFNDLDFVGYANDADIIRLKPNQEVYFNVSLFRGKNYIKGHVVNIGYKPITVNGMVMFPIEIEVENKVFFDRNQEYYLQAGVVAEAIIITESDIPFFRLIWEQIINAVNVD